MHGHIDQGHYTKKENESDILRLGNGSWTLNLDEIKGKEIHTITLITKEHEYSITYAYAFKVGYIRVFQGETKLVIPVKYWRKEKIS
jgi:hypothetical protein